MTGVLRRAECRVSMIPAAAAAASGTYVPGTAAEAYAIDAVAGVPVAVAATRSGRPA
jgi:hypothetical protein